MISQVQKIIQWVGLSITETNIEDVSLVLFQGPQGFQGNPGEPGEPGGGVSS